MDKLKMKPTKDSGFTLIETLVVLAILAILAAGGFAVVSWIAPTADATAGSIFKGAVRQFTVKALTDEGAEMTWNTAQGQLSIISLGSTPITQNYTLPKNVQITLNGNTFSCLVLNPKGFPDNGISNLPTPCTVTNPTTPFTWSITDGSSKLTFQ